MAQKNEVEILLELKDELSKTLKRVDKNLNSTTSTSKQTTASITKTQTAMKGMASAVKMAQTAMVGFIGLKTVLSIKDMIIETNAHKDSVLALSNATGIAVKELSSYDHIAKISKTSSQALTQSMQRLGMSIGQAGESATSAQAKAFKRLGVELKDANGNTKSMNVIFGDTIDALKNITNETDRLTTAQQIFGRGAKELGTIIQGGSVEFNKLRSEADQLGVTFDRISAEKSAKFNDSMARVDASFKALSMTIVEVATPAVTSYFDDLNAMITVTKANMAQLSKQDEKEKRIASRALSVLGKMQKEHIIDLEATEEQYKKGQITLDQYKFGLDFFGKKLNETRKFAQQYINTLKSFGVDTGALEAGFGLQQKQVKALKEASQEASSITPTPALSQKDKEDIASHWNAQQQYLAELQGKGMARQNISNAPRASDNRPISPQEQAHLASKIAYENAKYNSQIGELKKARMESDQQVSENRVSLMDNEVAQYKSQLIDTANGISDVLGGMASVFGDSDDEAVKLLKTMQAMAVTASAIASATNPLSAIGAGLGFFSQMQSFSNGGMVQGGSSSGDKQLVRANRGEVVMTQQEFISMRNSGSSGGGSIVVNISGNIGTDERKLAQMVTNGLQKSRELGTPRRAIA
jgi:hypothetical protein